MTKTIAETRLAHHEAKIIEAHGKVIEARRNWARSPNAANYVAEEVAQARVDDLLERWRALAEAQG